MSIQNLRDEIAIELELMETTVTELLALQKDALAHALTVRDITADGAFLAQFCNGVENILKRICYFHGVPLPEGDTWHITLFKLFCAPAQVPLPLLFDENLASMMAPYRRFRHVVYHSYGSILNWERMADGVSNIQVTFSRFKTSLTEYLSSLH